MPSQSVCTMTLKVLRDPIVSRDDLPQEQRTELCSAITRLGKIAAVSLLSPWSVAYWIELDPKAPRCPIPPTR
jgi:hypothetical protein